MSLEEIQHEILALLYEKLFKDPINGVSPSKLSEINHDNKIAQALELLESEGLIERRSNGMYKLRITAIDVYEDLLPPSAVSKKLEERKVIMEILKELYEHDNNQTMTYGDLSAKVSITSFPYMLATVEYLENKRLVKLFKPTGQNFQIKLTAEGYRSFQEHANDMSTAMASAYRILFRLENHLRLFVESKLRAKYGAEWWEKAVGLGLRKKVDEMKADEESLGWKVTTIRSITEYLSFDNLKAIIITNWNGVFDNVFKDQYKIHLRLKELENLRNGIAHTRTLSQDAMTRLEQYSQDIFNMTK